MKPICLVNGTVIDSGGNFNESADVLIADGKIAEVGKGLLAKGGDREVIDCTGCYICPGLIDIHVHFREPGQEAKETIASGSRGGGGGGFYDGVLHAEHDAGVG